MANICQFLNIMNWFYLSSQQTHAQFVVFKLFCKVIFARFCHKVECHKVIFAYYWWYFLQSLIRNFLTVQENSPVCCPADELMTFVSKTNIQEIKDTLQFKSKFSEHAANVKNKIANQLNSSIQDITFIGVHHRRTVSM